MRHPNTKVSLVEGRLFVDGILVEPTKNWWGDYKNLDGEERNTVYVYHEKVIAGITFKIYICTSSEVRLNTEQIEEYAKENPSAFSTKSTRIVVTESTVVNCILSGSVKILFCALSNCVVLDSSIVGWSDSQLCIVDSAVILYSVIARTRLSPNAFIEQSELKDSGFKLINEKGDWCPYTVAHSTIKSVVVGGWGTTEIVDCYLINSWFDHGGYLKLHSQRISDTHISPERIDVKNRLEFFTLTLPNMTLHVYSVKELEFEIAAEEHIASNHYTFRYGGSKFETDLCDFLNTYERENTDSVMQYVLDSIKSRINLLKEISDKE